MVLWCSGCSGAIDLLARDSFLMTHVSIVTNSNSWSNGLDIQTKPGNPKLTLATTQRKLLPISTRNTLEPRVVFPILFPISAHSSSLLNLLHYLPNRLVGTSNLEEGVMSGIDSFFIFFSTLFPYIVTLSHIT